jgi:hypothetical protein
MSTPSTEPSVYLELFHGRSPADEELDDWGQDGPVFGPLNFVHTTYCSDIKIQPKDRPNDNADELFIQSDMVYYDNVWYGDWTVFAVHDVKELSEELRARIVPFEETKSIPPNVRQMGAWRGIPREAPKIRKKKSNANERRSNQWTQKGTR